MDKASTVRLPQALRDQLDATRTGNNHYRPKYATKTKVSRKEARKSERLGRKQHKAAYFSSSLQKKRPAEEEPVDVPKAKRTRSKKSTLSTKTVSTTLPQAQKTSTGRNKRLAYPETVVPLSRNRKEDEEDAYIAYLETKLGYSKSKKTETNGDGLDDLFDFTNTIMGSLTQHDNSEGVTDEDDKLGESQSDTEESVFTDEDEDEGWQGMQDDDPAVVYDPLPEKPLPAEEEVTVRYVPPNLRKKECTTEKESESIVKLSRQLKGLLNRMSEQNMMAILDNIEGVYREHRRNDVTTTLTTLIIDSIASHSTLLDSYVVLYAAFVSSLHKIIGVEFAAHFVQSVVSAYEHHSTLYNKQPALGPYEGQDADDKGKECSNLIVLLSELYNFQVTSSLLIFDVIRGLLNSGISEFCVELLLKVVRNSGQQLRQDDPSSLKDIIQIVQSNVSNRNEPLSSRTRFMIETLTNLKNNKSKRNATQNQGLESVERMKKFLAGLVKKRHALAHEPLRVSLEDLHNSVKKGKWWLVGAAWDGDPLVDRQTEAKADKSTEQLEDSTSDLEKLARKQGMNSDIRRGIFVVIMSSDDYVDACERLSQLKLKEVQQREILRVLLHCCGNERSYNPYYTLVCQHLCRLSHSHKVTLQFCLWDFLRDIGESSVGGLEVMKNSELKNDVADAKVVSDTKIRNIAKAYGWWIAKDCVALTALKPVDFTSLKPTTQVFLRQMLVQIFISSQRATPVVTSASMNTHITWNRRPIEEIFIKTTRIQALAMGLLYFLSEAFRDSIEEEIGTAKLVDWACEVAKDTLRTTVE